LYSAIKKHTNMHVNRDSIYLIITATDDLRTNYFYQPGIIQATQAHSASSSLCG